VFRKTIRLLLSGGGLPLKDYPFVGFAAVIIHPHQLGHGLMFVSDLAYGLVSAFCDRKIKGINGIIRLIPIKTKPS
jgi:hypothetical protein